MNKGVFAAIAGLNETKTFSRVKPFNSTGIVIVFSPFVLLTSNSLDPLELSESTRFQQFEWSNS